MTDVAPGDWDDLVRTLRSDLETVSNGDPDDEEVRAAIDEVWAIVDAVEERVGPVDAEQIAGVLAVDVDGADDAIDVGAIPREFVSDDPRRASRLSRLVDLINVDEATSYDVGNLWRDGESADRAPGGDEPGATGDESPESSPSDEGETDDGEDDAAEKLRSALGDSLSEFRGRIEDARQDLVESPESDDGSPEEGSADDGHRSTGSSTPGSSRSSDRSTTAVSTIPSHRSDIGGVTHLSTVPGRGGRSRSSRSASTNDGDDGRDGSDDEA